MKTRKLSAEEKATKRRQLALAKAETSALSYLRKALGYTEESAAWREVADSTRAFFGRFATPSDVKSGSPLIEEKLRPALVRTCREFLHHAGGDNFGATAHAWMAVTRSALQAARLTGQPAKWEGHTAHPGSRAGVLLVDFRHPTRWWDYSEGTYSEASIRRVVDGQVAP